jgi:hypothetical protein
VVKNTHLRKSAVSSADKNIEFFVFLSAAGVKHCPQKRRVGSVFLFAACFHSLRKISGLWKTGG